MHTLETSTTHAHTGDTTHAHTGDTIHAHTGDTTHAHNGDKYDTCIPRISLFLIVRRYKTTHRFYLE